jgi:Glu-tRNA(Gln) amidotransferase subunit E-like FAD-binding protein
MLSKGLEYPCTGLECFLEGWNAFDRVGIPLYTVGMLSKGLECFRQCWNAFDSVGMPLYRVAMLSRGLESIRQSWNTFVQGWKAS